MKKLLITLAFFGLLASAFFAFYAFNMFIYNAKQATGNPPAPYAATLSGVYVCLPPKDKSGPQTMECKFGLKTESGEHYALDFGENAASTQFIAGEKGTFLGTITPLMLLSTDQWNKYDIVGIFSLKATNDANNF